MSWSVIRLVLVALSLTCGWPVERVQGGLILNNLAPGGGATASDKNFGAIGRWAQKFTATESGAISDVKLNIYRTNDNTNGFNTFNVELWSGAGSTPSSQLVVLTSGSWLSVTTVNSGTANTSAYADFPKNSFANNYTVTSGSSYWLVLSFAGNGPAAKRWTVNGSGYQTALYSYSSGSWTGVGTSASLGAQISVAPVPEIDPAGLGSVLAIVCGTVGLMERRRDGGGTSRRRS